MNAKAAMSDSLKRFRAEADAFVKSMRGQMVPADIYDAAVRERDAYRKTQK